MYNLKLHADFSRSIWEHEFSENQFPDAQIPCINISKMIIWKGWGFFLLSLHHCLPLSKERHFHAPILYLAVLQGIKTSGIPNERQLDTPFSKGMMNTQIHCLKKYTSNKILTLLSNSLSKLKMYIVLINCILIIAMVSQFRWTFNTQSLTITDNINSNVFFYKEKYDRVINQIFKLKIKLH